MTNPFSILDLPEDSSPEEVKTRWRELAKIHHPDHGGNSMRFEEYHLAYIKAYRLAQDAPCTECNGTGKVTKIQGFQSIQFLCTVCKGRKKRFK